jgi:hypothetical protein
MRNFQAMFDKKSSVKVCSKNFKQGPVDPDHIFKRDWDRDEKFSSRVWLLFFNQGLHKNFQARSG